MNGSIMVRFPVGTATLAVPSLGAATVLQGMSVLTFADCFTRGM